MKLGALIPLGDIGGSPQTVREYARGIAAEGFDFIEAGLRP